MCIAEEEVGLLCVAAPLARLVERAGGTAHTANSQPVSDAVPQDVHTSTTFAMGSDAHLQNMSRERYKEE